MQQCHIEDGGVVERLSYDPKTKRQAGANERSKPGTQVKQYGLTARNKKSEEGSLEDEEGSKRKISARQGAQIYDRLVQYQRRKDEAVKMLQKEKERQEAKQTEHTIHQSKGGNKEAGKAKKGETLEIFNRLNKEAETRKVRLYRKQQIQEVKGEMEMQSWFKPKTNQGVVVDRSTVFNAYSHRDNSYVVEASVLPRHYVSEQSKH